MPTSKRPERLVVDANAILAELLGGNACRVFFETAIVEQRDPDDVEVLALTLRLGVPLWSNDRDFEGTSVELFTTAQLLRLFFGPSGR